MKSMTTFSYADCNSHHLLNTTSPFCQMKNGKFECLVTVMLCMQVRITETESMELRM